MSLRIWVTVKPRAGREALEKVADGEYRAAVREPAREGKANRALVELLAERFSVPKSAIRVVSGLSGRKKLVEID